MPPKILNNLKKGLVGASEKKVSVAAAAVSIEYPRENEKVMPGHYAVRVTGYPGDQVQLSINKGEFQDCRFGAGHFWFDWYPVKSGKYTLVARLKKGGKGKAVSSTPRVCQVAN